jgi:hypothetical protein
MLENSKDLVVLVLSEKLYNQMNKIITNKSIRKNKINKRIINSKEKSKKRKNTILNKNNLQNRKNQNTDKKMLKNKNNQKLKYRKEQD